MAFGDAARFLRRHSSDHNTPLRRPTTEILVGVAATNVMDRTFCGDLSRWRVLAVPGIGRWSKLSSFPDV